MTPQAACTTFYGGYDAIAPDAGMDVDVSLDDPFQ